MSKMGIVVSASFVLSGIAAPNLCADTVTLAPAEGVTTNALSLYTGDTAVEINGPGTVRLNSGNIHTGGTTLSGGTLELSGDFDAGLPSPVGLGAFTVSGGTLRGSGAFGGNITGSSSVTVEAPDGWTWTGNNSFATNTLAAGSLEIGGGATSFAEQFFLGPLAGSDADVSFTMSGGTVAMKNRNLFLSPGNRIRSTFTMTGGAWNMAGKHPIVGYQTTYATNFMDISGSAVITNSDYFYVYKGAGNYGALNVHDGGLFATKGSLYADGSGALLDISVSNGGRINANKVTSSSGSTTAASVTDGGILGIAGAIEASGTTALSIDGGIVRNDSTASGGDNYFQFFQSSSPNPHDVRVAIGPKGATFRSGGKTEKYAQLYLNMSAIPAEAGETARGVTFDGGNWAYYTAQSYEGPTVIANGASLFLSGAGALPDSSVVTVGANSQLRIGNTDKSVASLTLGEGAILGFGSKSDTPPRKLVITDTVTLPSYAKIAIYSANTPVTTASNTAGTYTVLQVPADYAAALEAVQWSCATPASGKVYSFSVATSGSTATLSMTIADAASAEDAVATSGGTMVVSGNLNVDSAIDVRGILTVSGNVYGTADNEVDHSLTIHDGGVLEVRSGLIRPIQQEGYFFDLYLEEGGSIIVRNIEDGGDNSSFRDTSQTGPAYFHFNGGTLYPVGLNNASDGNRFYLNYQPATIGEHGLVIDLAKWERPEGFTWSTWDGKITSDWVRASVQGHVNHDPDCAGDDGGITVRGIKGDRSMVLFGGRFAGSTLNGGIRAEDGATVGATSSSLAGQTLSLAPGSRFRPYNSASTMSIGNLTLGETGATEPVALDGSNSKTLYNIVVTGRLDVQSSVAFSVCSDWYNDSAPLPGVYTALVYQATCSVDPTLFTLPTGMAGTLSAEEVTLSGGDYDGWKALVCTIAADDLVIIGAGDYPASATVSDAASYGKIIVGGSYDGVGVSGTGRSTSLTIEGNASVSASEALYLGYKTGTGEAAATPHQGSFTMNGGTLTVPAIYSAYRDADGDSECRYGVEMTINGGLLDVAGNVVFGRNRTKYGNLLYSQLTVNGGRVAVGGTFYLYYYNSSSFFSTPGSIVLNDGEVDVTGPIDLSRCTYYSDAFTSYTERYGLFLNGGILKAETIKMSRADAKPKVVFNGGTYMPYGAAAANRTMQNLNVAYVSAGGAVVSTENIPAGETYTIAQPLLTDPALDGAADGGLTKKGAETLVLTGANTFTGPVTVEKGVLAAGTADALSAFLTVSNGAGLYAPGTDLSFTNVAASGTIMADSVTVSGALELSTPGSLLSVDGDLTLENGAAIDFGLGEGEELGNDWVPVAAASGTMTSPSSLGAQNAGKTRRCETMVADGVLYVKPASAGFTIVVR